MGETYFELSLEDQGEALEIAAARSGRPAYLLEKDVWVVWALSVLFEAEVGQHLSFKGGTSLSKVYGIIDRFSEDIDLTYDIRAMLPDMAGDGDGIPPSRSQGQKWTEAVRQQLPGWIDQTIKPLLLAAMERDGVKATLRQEANERLYIDFPGHREGYGYVRPAVMLEFGARSTGEPTEPHQVVCDAAPHLSEISFPTAAPRVMKLERTFWEKATAAHVYCAQAQLKGERFARHWHDLAAMTLSPDYETAIEDRGIAGSVARHKAIFFREKDSEGSVVDYTAAVTGSLRIVPEGDARRVLEEDYRKMVEAGLLHGSAPSFDELMATCSVIQERANESFPD
ncbi:MAG: nucleotidyl transferase AbiEii/AbiGii toxin family protein [Nisaea sp.]|uniref:nucleotidyl transferase AbiEii/AbiGii toxin family protein n=1 Tax=Nisaea sp. TaxID=2024842 RepID=UPI001B0DCDB1|nr:nucleotidyl transferase AbiEii/AbiGii toxin family protein [Nisaea sp.]MBO6560269.1 nucleotidyl transferase AbiEii/AbiGii toxin family protein [Nisaea sp.]